MSNPGTKYQTRKQNVKCGNEISIPGTKYEMWELNIKSGNKISNHKISNPEQIIKPRNKMSNPGLLAAKLAL